MAAIRSVIEILADDNVRHQLHPIRPPKEDLIKLKMNLMLQIAMLDAMIDYDMTYKQAGSEVLGLHMKEYNEEV